MNFFKNKLVVTLMIMIGFAMFFIWQNNDLVTTSVVYKNEKISKKFDNFKIVHISDLHNKMFGKGQEKILQKIISAKPQIIVITGDLIDRRRYDLEKAMIFIDGAVDIAPVYYVSGNHEAWSGQYETIKEKLVKSGVIVLDDEKRDISIDNSTIEILGLKDPAFLTSNYLDGSNLSSLEKSLESLSQSDNFQILLSHRPELFSLYAQNDIDLAFAGHAHGGQFRIPFLGGLVAPDQGLFPEYTSGSHNIKSSTLIVSRGLGNSIIPVRIFNRPEIVEVTLKSEK
nr:metallophosphoesterase [Tissierella sp.]